MYNGLHPLGLLEFLNRPQPRQVNRPVPDRAHSPMVLSHGFPVFRGAETRDNQGRLGVDLGYQTCRSPAVSDLV